MHYIHQLCVGTILLQSITSCSYLCTEKAQNVFSAQLWFKMENHKRGLGLCSDKSIKTPFLTMPNMPKLKRYRKKSEFHQD